MFGDIGRLLERCIDLRKTWVAEAINGLIAFLPKLRERERRTVVQIPSSAVVEYPLPIALSARGNVI